MSGNFYFPTETGDYEYDWVRTKEQLTFFLFLGWCEAHPTYCILSHSQATRTIKINPLINIRVATHCLKVYMGFQ